MTLPYERRWAVDNTRQFLVDLQSDLSAPDAAPEVFGNWEDMNHE